MPRLPARVWRCGSTVKLDVVVGAAAALARAQAAERCVAQTPLDGSGGMSSSAGAVHAVARAAGLSTMGIVSTLARPGPLLRSGGR